MCPCDRHKIMSQLELAYCNLSNVFQFKYLRRAIEHACGDDCDINRELRLFASLIFLLRRFSYCSVKVKLNSFTAYCILFYDIVSLGLL